MARRKRKTQQTVVAASSSPLLSEFGSRCSAWLATGWLPGVLVASAVAAVSILVLLIGHLAGLNGAVLVFTFTDPPLSAEYTHVFGYLAEANFGAFSIIGLPLMLFFALSYARACGSALGNLQTLARKNVPSQNLPCALATRLNRRIFRIFPALALLLLAVFLKVQWTAFDDARRLASPAITPDGTERVSDWDFGLYQIPFLEGPKRAFNKWNAADKLRLLQKRGYLDRLEANRPAAQIPLASSAGAAQGAAKPATIPDIVTRDATTLSLDFKPTLLPTAFRPIYWVFFVASQVLVVLSYLVAVWLVGKVLLWLWLLWFCLPQPVSDSRGALLGIVSRLCPPLATWLRACRTSAAVEGRYVELDRRDEERLFGIGSVWPPVRWLFYAVAVGTIYFSLQHAAPSLDAALSVSGRQGSTETLATNLLLVLFGLGIGIGGQAFLVWRATRTCLPAKGQRVVPSLVFGSKPVAIAILVILLSSVGPSVVPRLPASWKAYAAWPTKIRSVLWKTTANLYHLPLRP
jgi:hypothetical protein